MTGFSVQTHLIPRTNFLAHKRYALKCLFSPDMTYVDLILPGNNRSFFSSNSLLATTSADGTAKIWRTSDFACQYELKHDRLQNWVWDCAFTSDSLFLVTGLYLTFLFYCCFFMIQFSSMLGREGTSMVNGKWGY
jgi:G protein beta subunit-like protein